MESANKLLLDIYDSAQHCTLSGFNEYALNKLKKTVHFDSAVIVDFANTQQQKFIIQAIHLHAAPVEKLLDRPKAMGAEKFDRNGSLDSRDFVLKKACAHRGRSVIADLTSGVSDTEILDYCRKYETAHSLTLVSAQSLIDTIPTIALWRAARSNAYADKDAYAANQLLPHILQAKEINRRLATLSSSAAHGSAIVLATLDGCVQFVQQDAIRLLQLEWSEWTPPLLPRSLMDSLKAGKEKAFTGTSLDVKASVQGNILCLVIAVKPSKKTGLTNAEYRVAKLAADGFQYKEIARELGVSTATVRNQLHSAYQKLGVSNKTALASVLPP